MTTIKFKDGLGTWMTGTTCGDYIREPHGDLLPVIVEDNFLGLTYVGFVVRRGLAEKIGEGNRHTSRDAAVAEAIEMRDAIHEQRGYAFAIRSPYQREG